MNRVVRFLLGSAVLAAALVAVGWYDSVVMVAARREEASTFNIDPYLIARAGGFLLLAGSILIIAFTGWRLRSIELGVAYLLAGAFFTFLDTITWKLSAEINGVPPILPRPILDIVERFYSWEQGPLSGALILGAGTLLVGLALLASPIIGRRLKAPTPAGQPDRGAVPDGT